MGIGALWVGREHSIFLVRAFFQGFGGVLAACLCFAWVWFHGGIGFVLG